MKIIIKEIVITLLLGIVISIHSMDQDIKKLLFYAVRSNNFDGFNNLMTGDTDFSIVDDDKNTLLMQAANSNPNTENNEKIITLLLEKSPLLTLEARNEYGNTALMIAIESKNLKAAELIISYIQDKVNKPISFFDAINTNKMNALLLITSIHQKLYQDALKITNELIQAKVDLNMKNSKGNNALMLSIKHDNTDAAKLLIESGIKLDAQNNDKDSALMLAAYYKHDDIAQILIDKNVNISLRDKEGKDALMLSIDRNNNQKIALAILNKSTLTELDKPDNTQQTALMYATFRKRFDVVKALIDKKVNLQLKNSKHQNALSLAIQTYNFPIAELLIKNSTTKELKTQVESDKLTLLEYAINQFPRSSTEEEEEKALTNIIKKLLSKKIPVTTNAIAMALKIYMENTNIKSIVDLLIEHSTLESLNSAHSEAGGATFLIIATAFNQKDIITQLIKKGVDFNKQTTKDIPLDDGSNKITKGSTALDVAKQLDHKDIIILLENAIKSKSSKQEKSKIETGSENLIKRISQLHQHLQNLKTSLQK